MSSEIDVILVLDIGSSSIRCSAYKLANGNIQALSHCSSSNKMSSVKPNTGKIRLEHLFNELDACIDETLERVRKKGPFQVVAFGFSSFVMNLMGVDEDGQIVGETASISYACNTPEVAKEVLALRSQLGEEAATEMYKKTGAPIHSAYALPQLRVLYGSGDAVCRRIHKWQTVASICLSRWTGQMHLPISYSEASWTGLLNYCQCRYEQLVLDLLPEQCQKALPDLADFDEPSLVPIGLPKSSSYWERWPELQSTRFFLGLGDGACANVGSKCSTADRIACTVGTSAAARVCLPLPVGSENVQVLPGLFCYRIDRSHVLVGGALTDGGSVVEWVSQLLNLSSDETFLECLKKVEQLADEDYASADTQPSLTVVPFLSGERSTGFRSGATGTMIGLTRETTPAHLLKSSLEGVTMRVNVIVKLIRKVIHTNEAPRIIASGRALEVNDLWRQMLADCSTLEVVLDEDTKEGSSRGAACLVAMALAMDEAGASESIKFLRTEEVQSTKVSVPRLAAKPYWEKATKAQDTLIEAVSPLYAQLS